MKPGSEETESVVEFANANSAEPAGSGEAHLLQTLPVVGVTHHGGGRGNRAVGREMV